VKTLYWVNLIQVVKLHLLCNLNHWTVFRSRNHIFVFQKQVKETVLERNTSFLMTFNSENSLSYKQSLRKNQRVILLKELLHQRFRQKTQKLTMIQKL